MVLTACLACTSVCVCVCINIYVCVSSCNIWRVFREKKLALFCLILVFRCVYSTDGRTLDSKKGLPPSSSSLLLLSPSADISPNVSLYLFACVMKGYWPQQFPMKLNWLNYSSYFSAGNGSPVGTKRSPWVLVSDVEALTNCCYPL